MVEQYAIDEQSSLSKMKVYIQSNNYSQSGYGSQSKMSGNSVMSINGTQTKYDREKELREFDNTKTGVKGLVDSGVKTIPKIFIRPLEEISEDSKPQNVNNKLVLPVIDLAKIHTNNNSRRELVEQIENASAKWGFFQVINHGIPLNVIEKMLEMVKMFHEQDVEVKMKYYGRDVHTNKQVVYDSNFDLFTSKNAYWRDTLSVNTAFTGQLDPELLPPICRDAILDHIKHMVQLGSVLLELMSEALGLGPDYLKELECDKNWSSVYHYYPSCPQPELTIGTPKHTDSSFFTVLLQDQVGGLQIRHDDQWVDVRPIPGALVINIGDLLQMITNDKFISVLHRVKANPVGPRLSSAFFFAGLSSKPKKYGPIRELLSEENPPIYRDFTVGEYVTHFFSKPQDEPGRNHFMLN
ncbi:1-aminocyclopropane-1-carboxylate oxidase homolog 1-like [Silene latifolia]|uniref:1-aminocyclopropane-1-carboxylate oxidase homolog 1-like n=1 Tax=Silene latifolia TaxID=37657 RepID=UPI003D774E3F